MSVRRCGRCGETKDVDQFAWRRKERNQRDNYCRPCRSAYKREHYQANKARYIETAAKRGHRVAGERLVWLIEFLRTHPCVDCGESDPIVLEFDHLRDKSFTIGRSFRYLKWSTILTRSQSAMLFAPIVTDVGQPLLAASFVRR